MASPTDRSARRDRALRRVRRATWGTGAAVAGLAAGLSVVAAHAFKGHSGATTTSTTTPPRRDHARTTASRSRGRSTSRRSPPSRWRRPRARRAPRRRSRSPSLPSAVSRRRSRRRFPSPPRPSPAAHDRRPDDGDVGRARHLRERGRHRPATRSRRRAPPSRRSLPRSTWRAAASATTPSCPALNARAGRTTRVGPLLLDAIEVALRAAALTDGIVDPTIGRRADRRRLRPRLRAAASGAAPRHAGRRATAGWRAVAVDRARGTVRVPDGVLLDLGATAKALAADRAAAAASAAAASAACSSTSAATSPSPARRRRAAGPSASPTTIARRRRAGADDRDRRRRPRHVEHHRPALGRGRAPHHRPPDRPPAPPRAGGRSASPPRPASTRTSRALPRSCWRAERRTGSARAGSRRGWSTRRRDDAVGGWPLTRGGRRMILAAPRSVGALVRHPRHRRDHARPADGERRARHRRGPRLATGRLAALRGRVAAPDACRCWRSRCSPSTSSRRCSTRSRRSPSPTRSSRSRPATGRCGSDSAPSRPTSWSRSS